MNWLAHLFLSNYQIEHQIANILADPLKGKSWEKASYHTYHGMFTHKKIDSFTDQHPIVLKSKASLTQKGYLKGVVIDILYDYFLSTHWHQFCHIPREAFIDEFHQKASKSIRTYPKNAKNVISSLIDTGQLYSYHELNGVLLAFGRIDKRLSQRALKKDNATRYFEFILKEKKNLEQDFLNFFPQLMHHTKIDCQLNNIQHWKE